MTNVCPSETGLMSRKAKLRSECSVLSVESRVIAIIWQYCTCVPFRRSWRWGCYLHRPIIVRINIPILSAFLLDEADNWCTPFMIPQKMQLSSLNMRRSMSLCYQLHTYLKGWRSSLLGFLKYSTMFRFKMGYVCALSVFVNSRLRHPITSGIRIVNWRILHMYYEGCDVASLWPLTWSVISCNTDAEKQLFWVSSLTISQR